MQLLTAVNGILPVLGERPVTSLNATSPTLAIILPRIAQEIDDLLTPGMWFNSSSTTLYPAVDGSIDVGADVLSFVPTTVHAVLRGRALFNVADSNFTWPEPVQGNMIVRLAFDELPDSAAQFVLYSTMVSAYATDIGLEGSIQLWQAKASQAQRNMLREHLRQQKYTTRRSPRYQSMRNAMRA